MLTRFLFLVPMAVSVVRSLSKEEMAKICDLKGGLLTWRSGNTGKLVPAPATITAADCLTHCMGNDRYVGMTMIQNRGPPSASFENDKKDYCSCVLEDWDSVTPITAMQYCKIEKPAGGAGGGGGSLTDGGAGGGGGSLTDGGAGSGGGAATECAGKTNLSRGLYIRTNKPKLEEKTKLVDDNKDPICECHDLCKVKGADAFMYYAKGKKKTKAICKCYKNIVAANESGKLKLAIGGKRTAGKNTGWITDAGKNLISGDNAKETKRRQIERRRRRRRRN